MPKQTQRRRSLHIVQMHDQHLEAWCRGISSCQAGDNPKIPSSHPHCYQYLHGAKLCLSDLHNDDSRCRTAGCSLTSYPGPSRWSWLITVVICKNSFQDKNSLFTYKRHLQENDYDDKVPKVQIQTRFSRIKNLELDRYICACGRSKWHDILHESVNEYLRSDLSVV